MQPARVLILRRPAMLAILLFCTLLVRLLVPAGYMPAPSASGMTLTLCSGTMPAAPAVTGMAGMHHGAADHAPAAGKADQPCAFACLGLPALGAADPVLAAAALAIAFLLAIVRVTRLAPAAPERLRPPLRAPPSRV